MAAVNNVPNIYGMSYNSARDELFLAYNGVVSAMRVRDNAGDLRDVYRAALDTSQLGLPGVMKTKTGLDQFYKKNFIK